MAVTAQSSGHRRAALFVDFENVYSGLCASSRNAGQRFATDPARWVRWMEQDLGSLLLDDSAELPRALLRRICYLDPAQSSRFRPYFTRAGFRVVDCPALTSAGKNSADINMVLDILDTLAHPTRFDDFIVLSVDADFTPVLLRLREHDRRTAMLVSGPSAPALRAACDYAIPDGMFLDEALGLDPGSAAGEYSGEPHATNAGRPPETEHTELHQQMEAVVRQALVDSRRPLALAAVAGRVERALGHQVHVSRWAGAGSFKNFLAGIEDDHLVVDSAPPAGWLRDPGRHGPAPHGYPLNAAGVDLPEVAERICRVVGVPPLSPDEYATVFEAIAEVGRPRSTEGQAPVERAVRDACTARERAVPRAAIHFVLLGYRYAGYDWTSPELDPGDLAHAFADNTLTIAARAEMDLTDDDQRQVRRWITGGIGRPSNRTGLSLPAAASGLLAQASEQSCPGAGAAG